MITGTDGEDERAMDTTMVIRRLSGLAIGLGVLLILLCALPAASVADQGTPEASPQASPVAIGNGCDGLGTYFHRLADLTRENAGLVIMRKAGFDALALTDEEAATVVASLDGLILDLNAIVAPAPAVRYHGAYLEMLAWYRDLATDRDQASYQRLINNDRRLFAIMGQAIRYGESTCGYNAWNDARDAAFPPEE